MKKDTRQFFDIFLRYVIMILVAFPGLWIFYFIFTPLTIYPIYLFLDLFLETSLIGNIIILDNFAIELIRACIAGSAFYLLLVLNLSTPRIEIKKRIKILFMAFALLLVLNILRILFLVWIFFLGFSFFDAVHNVFWYFVSTVFVVGIWFTQVKIFKIKEIPFLSDLKFIYKKSSLKK
jgi:exosortase/archaeosortase family protein